MVLRIHGMDEAGVRFPVGPPDLYIVLKNKDILEIELATDKRYFLADNYLPPYAPKLQNFKSSLPRIFIIIKSTAFSMAEF